MQVERVYDQLNNDMPEEQAKIILKRFLKDQIKARAQYPERADDIADGISSLLSAQSVIKLPLGDPYSKALYMSLDLVLPAAYWPEGTSWPAFTALVDQL